MKNRFSAKSKMKRKCKGINISDINYIKSCIYDWYDHKSGKKKQKKSVQEILVRYDGIDGLAAQLQREIESKHLDLEKIRTADIIDKSNGKPRKLTIESPKRQIYNYIASNALKDLDSRCGFYQINMCEGGSPLMAVKYVKQWMKDKSIKYVAHLDVKKCYPSITKENMMQWLKKHAANDDLLWLIDQLLEEPGCLPIGSFLSIRLCGLYMSDAYHFIENNFKYFRKGKSLKAIKHQLFYLDDIFLFSSNARKLLNSIKEINEYFETVGLKIKETWKIISLKGKDAHIDILGYKVYRNRVTMRRRDYLKAKKSLRDFKRHRRSCKKAMSYISHYGLFLSKTNSIKFRKKYNADHYYRLARKVVSKHAKGNFRPEAR